MIDFNRNNRNGRDLDLRVFLAEDADDDRLFFEHALRLHSPRCEYRSFETGSALLEALEQATLHPHIVFLDAYLPGLSGVEIYHRIQQHPVWMTIPVILLTSLIGDREELARRHQIESERWFEKPESVAKLATIIRQQISCL